MAVAISVVVPAYNAMRTIKACVESLRKLSPESPTHELIVVDNGSNDGTGECLRHYPDVRLVEESAVRGPAAARNAGARAAMGDILAFTDADCIVTPDWLINGSAPLADPRICAVAGMIRGVEPENEIQRWMNDRAILDPRSTLAHPFRPFVQTANAFYRREDFRQVDGFDRALLSGEDADLSWRIQALTGGRIELVQDALVYHDHRSDIRGLLRQSATNAAATAWLAAKWGDAFPPKHWKTSVWELLDLGRSGARYLGLTLAGKPRPERITAKLDFLFRLGRKRGMIASAWRAKQYGRW